MPKATDVNGVEWGKSELTISGLAALGAAQKAARLAGRLGQKIKMERAAEETSEEIL